ncbi:MFS transporter [Pseudorhodoplanes sp.]|uniref:MFS transporter n=1 Tax=Pseudorhodoplanes sp. TaxID=1934341 RepID=UPI002C80961F|nr:MFS transporter [Pseudorhodoplanes sp.]HWV41813.1 MFS transporter [Pseudorhodoplanes sp.]
MTADVARRDSIATRDTVVLVMALAGIYMVSQFLRNSVGVIAPNLATELNLSASEVGLLSSVFFFSFAAAQIPLGVALDRYGPRRCMLVCAGIAIVGTLMFAAVASPFWLTVARVLMGLGSSCYLMAPLALYAKRFPPDRFATLVGVQLGLGTVGTLLATAPFAFAVALIGWRMSFVVIAGMVVAAAILVSVVVKDDKDGTPRARETLRDSLKGTLAAIRVPSFWPVFAVQLASYSSFVVVVGLWGGPYLTHIYGYSLTERGNMLFVAVLAQIVGSMLWGPSDRLFNSYKIPILIGLLLTAATLGLAAIVGIFSPIALFLWFVAIGLFPAVLSVVIANGKSLFPPVLVGRGMTLMNMGTMGGVFVSQSVTGAVIDLFPITTEGYALNAYRAVFGFQAVFILLTLLIFLWARDPRRSPPSWG